MLVAFCQFWYQLSSSLNLQTNMNLREKLHCIQPDRVWYCSGALGIPPILLTLLDQVWSPSPNLQIPDLVSAHVL